jgi:hypothetical protein
MSDKTMPCDPEPYVPREHNLPMSSVNRYPDDYNGIAKGNLGVKDLPKPRALTHPNLPFKLK